MVQKGEMDSACRGLLYLYNDPIVWLPRMWSEFAVVATQSIWSPVATPAPMGGGTKGHPQPSLLALG